MGHLARVRNHLRLLPLLCALAALVLAALLGSAARAEEPAAKDAPKVLCELPERRTAYATCYLLDSGQYRSVFSQSPVHYKDEEGDWQPIDLTPEAQADGSYEVNAAAVPVSFADQAPGIAPVTLQTTDGPVSMDLLGAGEDDATSDGRAVCYTEVLPDLDVVYEATGDGVKETLVLASAKAPDFYTYRLTHPGFTLKQDESGEWGLYAGKAERPTLCLGGLRVYDSSQAEDGAPAFCDGARLTVSPSKDVSTVTYSVPRAWLLDPARVWPVEIDPNLFTRNPNDTYISKGYPNTCYGTSEELWSGKWDTQSDVCKTLVKFPQLDNENNLPDGAHVSSATFSIRQFWQPDTNHDLTHVYRVGVGSTLWGEAGTWNTITITDSVLLADVSVAGAAWLNLDVTGSVQYWADRADSYNKGFVIRRVAGEDSSYRRKFRSGEYSNADYRPKLTVDWEEPTVAVTPSTTTASVGETVTATLALGQEAAPYTLYDPSQVSCVRLGINRTDADTSRRRGVFAWFKEIPSSAGWVYQRARNASAEPDGYFAYYASTAYGSDKVTPLLDQCVIADDHESVSFAFAPEEDWGSPDDNQLDTYLDLTAGSSLWSSGWVSQSSATFDVAQNAGVPQGLSSLTATTSASTGWFSGTTNDTADQGRGSVTLSWPAVPLADSYKVYLWDGVKYDHLATTASTSWTTPSDIFPTDTQIAGLSSEDDPFDRTNGVPLRDDPNPLYQKMAGSTNRDTDYRFKVVPHNDAYASGAGIDADIDACAPLRLTLDSRTVTANEDPQHTDYEFEEWSQHAIGARLESGALTARTTDLEIASYGPPAEISRAYISSETAAGLYAPGWFFNFEQSLALGASQIVFTDALRQTHTFTGSGSAWSAPNGFMASLAPEGSDWKLSFFDGASLLFDSSGTLIAIEDDHGNETTYTWTSGELTEITAANGQEIELTYSSGKLVSASYATAAGTRSVTYATSSPWSLTFYPGTACESELTYTYDASTRLSGIRQEDWPSSGNSVTESFLYSSGMLSELRFADYDATSKPDARLSISYGTNQATIERYGTVDGSANQAMNREVLTWRGPSSPVPYQLTSHTAGSGANALTESYSYAFDRQPAVLASSDGGLTTRTIDTDHNLTSETITTASLQSANQTTEYGYDTAHHVVIEQVYQSPTTYARTIRTYAGVDVTAEQTVDQSGKLLSSATYAYDALGRPTQQRERISESPEVWKQTDFADFAANGEPQSVTAVGIKLCSSASPQDLTMTRSYDAFGNLLTESDWSGSRTVQANTYDIAGCLLTSTDAAGVTSHSLYDAMGNVTETYDTAPGTQMKAAWTVATYDAMGRSLSQTTKLSDGSGNPTTAAAETVSYDGNGQELSCDDSTLGGQDAVTLYDADGNVVEEWQEGVLSYATDGSSLRSEYDAEGNVIYESEVGNPNDPGEDTGSAEMTYDEAGNLITEERPDGTMEEITLDAQGNEVKIEAVATDSSTAFSPWTSEQVYDAAGQPVATTDAQESHVGLVTETTVDLLGRETASEAQRDGQTTVATERTYNNLHWELSSVDANGVATATTYNSHGEVVSQAVGTKSVTCAYNATTGRLESITDSDGIKVTCTYDAFGNLTGELHETQSGSDLKDISTTYDSLGRPLTEDDAVSGATHGWSYPQNAATGTQESLSYGASAATSLEIARSGRDLESARTATIASANTVTRTVTARDAADRWTEATIAPTGGSTKTLSRSFDAADRLTSQSGLGLSAAGSYTYDPNTSLLTGLSLPLANGGALLESYSYHPGGRLAEATTAAGAAAYAFDEVGNLVREEVSDVGETTFIYDSANRLTQSSYLAAEETASPVSTYYGWDTQNAWRTSQGSTTTATSHEIQMGYTALGRMNSYANSATSTTATYGYDATGQRLSSSVTVSGTTTATSYLYDGLSLLALSATRGSDSWKIEYLYDENEVPFGGVYRAPASSTSPVYFSLVTNERGDVLALCDADGAAFASYRYDAWGSPAASSTQATSLIGSTLAGEIAARQILRYASYAYDAESGLYYCSARYYDPATRQWTTGDPAKADGEESSYQYCAGNPVADSDPSGEWSLSNAFKKVGDWAKSSGVASALHQVAMVAVPGYDVAYDLIKYRRFTWESAVSLGTCFIPGGPVVRIVGKVAAKTVAKVAVKTATKYVAPAAAKVMRQAAKRVVPAARKLVGRSGTSVLRGGESWAAKNGRAYHELAARHARRTKSQKGWLVEKGVKIRGKTYRPDMHHPQRKLIIDHKPDTISGRYRGRVAAKRYQKAFGPEYKVRINHYNPNKNWVLRNKLQRRFVRGR